MVKYYLLQIIFILSFSINAQTSWKGTTSTNWSTVSNWTSGIPNATTDAIIGDASFTGSFQPVLTVNSSCKSLTLGSSTKASTLTIAKNITISGTLTIGANGTISHTAANTIITVKGNWANSGVYTASVTTNKVTFAGATQSLAGATTFKQVIINSGSTLTLGANIVITNFLSISGTMDPTASYLASGTGSLTVNSTGKILVKAADFTSNYNFSGAITLHGTSTVNYASASINQNITNTLTYGYLRASGGMTKTLVGNLPTLNSSSANSGRIYVDAGTLDLLGYTANRGTTVTGGFITIAASSSLKIGGTNTFPANFATKSLATNSTVEYNGTNQTVLAATYGNLIFSSSSGSVVKTMPITAMTIAGSFTSTVGSGTAVTFTAGNNITINLNTYLDANSTFNGGAFSHTFKKNWLNDGAFNGGTSTCVFNGINAILSGTGVNNFNNLSFTNSGISAASSTSVNVSGNLRTTGAGAFANSNGGLVTMTGTAKTITGNGIKLKDLIITGSITTNASITISGDFTINGSLSASAGIITLNGTTKSILGAGTLTLSSLSVIGTISTAKNFVLNANLTVALTGSFNQTSGTSTFNGAANTLAGTASLYNVTINSGKTLTLGSNAELGIANIFTKTGALNVIATVPNTIRYNSTSAQSIVNTTYHNLILDNNSTKTAAGAITVNNDFTINSTATFNASSYLFSLYRNFINNGTFTASTSTVQLLGASAADITGTTTFNNLTENKSSSVIKVTLNSSIITNTLTMTTGNMSTGTNTVTINSTRTGAGIVIGIIAHNHTFENGTTYYFEGPQNGITFNAPSAGLTLVTVTVTIGSVPDFIGGNCINREYNISIPTGTYTDAKLQFHYEDNELNTFDEPTLNQYHYNTGTFLWDSIGVTTLNATTNYVEKTPITSLSGRWALSGRRNVVSWNGSVSSAWETLANWTTISGTSLLNRLPTSSDAVEIGLATFTNNPVINSNVAIYKLKYGSVKQSTLTISSGYSLAISSAIIGTWSGSSSHVLDVGSGTLTVGTDVDLSDGVSGHDIELRIGSGSVIITNDLNQKATGSVNFTESGSLSVAGNYNYTAGNFIPNTGTMIYTGGISQIVAPLTYYNLSFTKSTEEATTHAPLRVNGNLTISTGGNLRISDTLTVAGNITIGASTNLIETGARINVGGNWTNNGIFTLANGEVNFNGAGNQTVNANTFNTLLVNKIDGTLTLTGDISINSDLSIMSGTMDISSYLCNRSSTGGILTLGASAYLKISGTSNFPANFITNTLDAASTVEYYGTIAQNVTDVDYGNLTISNGGSTAKLLLGNVLINGNLLINTGSTLNPDSTLLTIYGNIINNGTFSPGGSTMLLSGTSKTLNGDWTFYNLSVIGSYTSTGTTITMTGNFNISGSLDLNTTNASLDGDLTNSGSLNSNGIATFTGTKVQTIQLSNAITSSAGTINFNGTVSPILNSNSSPQYAILNINNTGGVTASVPWIVAIAFNIGAGATFDGGGSSHTFLGSVTNNGTIISSGNMNFTPIPPYSSSSTINLGTSSYTCSGTTKFGGTVPMTITGTNPSLFNVDISNSDANGITPSDNWLIQNDLLINTGAIFNGGAVLSHTIGADLTNNGTLTGNTSSITFTASPATINGIGSTTFNHLTIASGCDMSLNQDLNILRNFVNDGTFTPNGFELIFTGTDNSIISGASGTLVLDELDQDKTGGAVTTLSVPVIINTNLHLLNGVINTTTTNIITITDDAIATGGTATTYVNGPMKKIGNDAFEFPIGNNTYFARIGMSAPTTSTSEFQAQYNAAAYTNTSSVTLPLTDISTMEHWILNRNIGTDNVSVTLFWEDGTRSGIDDLTDIVVARFNGTSWVNETQDGGVTGTTSIGSVTSSLVTSFSPFTFGSKLRTLNPLPIELIDFNGVCTSEGVQLNWTTASEYNNDYFLVEKSSNGLNWVEIAKVKGMENSTTINKYVESITTPQNGLAYYRLSQADIGGSVKVFRTIDLTCSSTKDKMILYTNPLSSEINVILDVNNPSSQNTISLINHTGQIIFENKIDLVKGRNYFTFPIDLASGLYTIAFSSDKLVFPTQKLMIIRP